MPIVPTGSPAWLRTASHESYGGNENKRNYLSQGVVDATTDVGAEEFSRMVADLAAVARTAPKCVISYDNNDSSPAAPTVVSVRMMTGVRLVPYEGNLAPAGLPSAVRNGNGDVTFTFLSSYLDEYGVSGSFEITDASASAHGASFIEAVAEIATTVTVRVRCLDDAGNPELDVRVTLVIG